MTNLGGIFQKTLDASRGLSAYLTPQFRRWSLAHRIRVLRPPLTAPVKVMDRPIDHIRWSSRFTVTPARQTPKLPGDKITLPQSALEQLLAAAPLQEISPQGGPPPRPYTSTFDPFNPYTFAAESQARERNLDRQHQLPHPLTFRIVNPQNGRVVYAGIREFSAPENEIGLSPFLRDTLEVETSSTSPDTTAAQDVEQDDEGHGQVAPIVTVHAKQLPKGTYVRLRPLEAGYDPEDWKALLERHLRDNYTTLTTGEVLEVAGGRAESFRFLVDKVEPEGEGICVVDTDLEVDIVALSEDQARETLRRRLAKASRAPGTKGGTSIGGVLELGGQPVTGQVVPGEYADYELRKWDGGNAIEVIVEGVDDADVSLLISPFSARQRNRPRQDEFVFGDLSSQSRKQITIQPTNVELEGAEALYISVHAFAPPGHDGEQHLPLQYNLQLSSRSVPGDSGRMSDSSFETHEPGDVQCKNCHQWVSQRSFMLHETFCFRNNILCPQCNNVFQKRSPQWQNHWHCPHDSLHGNDAISKQKHDLVFHSNYFCHACGFETDGLPRLAQHRTSECPSKPILCQFCHLVVPQKGDTDPDMHDPEVLVSGLTPHELVDGGRTTECHLCNKIVRLRDMKTHLRHHDLDRISRPVPTICLNRNCGRTLDGRGAQTAIKPGTNTLGLCSICFGPLYVDTYDPEGKALRRRIERRYLSQLMTGCGKSWCQNEYCKTGKQNRQSDAKLAAATPASTGGAANVLNTVRPLVNAIDLQEKASNTAPFYLCTDQAGQQRRLLAEMIAAEDGSQSGNGKRYELPWCIGAVEAAGGDLDKAREWLQNWAPTQGEI